LEALTYFFWNVPLQPGRVGDAGVGIPFTVSILCVAQGKDISGQDILKNQKQRPQAQSLPLHSPRVQTGGGGTACPIHQASNAFCRRCQPGLNLIQFNSVLTSLVGGSVPQGHAPRKCPQDRVQPVLLTNLLYVNRSSHHSLLGFD
jgi:hypothetical protein